MKVIQKIFSKLIRSQRRRKFSRIDLLALLFLGAVVMMNLLLHPMSAHAAQASSTRVARPKSLTTPTKSTQSHNLLAGIPGQANPDPFAVSGCPIAGLQNVQYPNLNPKLRDPFGEKDVLFYFTAPGLTVENCTVQRLQQVVLDIANAFAVIVFVLAGLRIMLGGSVFRYANVIETLPGILLAILAANLSLYIVALALVLNNAMSAGFYNAASQVDVTQAQYLGSPIVTQTCSSMVTGVVSGMEIVGSPLGFLAGHLLGCDNVANWQQQLQGQAQAPNITGGTSLTGILFLYHSLTDLLRDITGIMVLVMMGQMTIRLFFIELYILVAPLGMGAWALPGRSGQTLTRIWLQGFFPLLFAQFVQVVGLAVVRIMVGAVTVGLYASFTTGGATNKDATLLWIIQIAQLWFLIRLPSILIGGPAGSPITMMGSFGQTMAQTAQSAASSTATQIQFVMGAASSLMNLGIMGMGLLG